MNFKLSELAAMLGLSVNTEAEITHVALDSRDVRPGTLFVALPGERVDGHDFAAQAVQNGAAAVLVSRPVEVACEQLLVPDTTKALQELARRHRERLAPRMVGVTGSVGKTTTKEFVYAVLSEGFPTFRTQGNANSMVGLPRGLLSLSPEHTAAVCEMGMGRAGEISALSRVVQPEVAVLTNIGEAHIEFFGSREKIRRAKFEIFDGMSPESTVILNGDDPLLTPSVLAAGGETLDDVRFPKNIRYYGIKNRDADVRAEALQAFPEKGYTEFDILCADGRFPARIHTLGEHNVLNALAAFLCGRIFGMDPQACIRGLLRFESGEGRQHIRQEDGLTIIDDTYNASADSIAAALHVATQCRQGGAKRIAVLSDILEAGTHSEAIHRKVGALCARGGTDILLAYGNNARLYAQEAAACGMKADAALYFDDKQKTAEKLRELAAPGDVILFKGSRGMAVEDILALFLKEWKKK